MILANSDIISQYPAQLYYSALPFLPSDTYLARQYATPRGCISVVIGRENSWTPLLFMLPQGVAAFAPGGHMVAVAPWTAHKIQIYNASNGLLDSSIKRISSTSPVLAAFTEDGSGVVVVSSDFGRFYEIEKFNLVKQSSQICRTTQLENRSLKLSEYGSYVAFAEHMDRDTRVCIWKIDGSNDILIPLDGDEVQDLDLAGESVHLVAVAAKDITILSIPSGAVQRTLYHEGAKSVHISRDGSFLVSWTGEEEARLWSITQGTLLATFETERRPVFSRTNRLYVNDSSSVRVYDASADLNNVTIKWFPLSSRAEYLLPMPDESRILIHTDDHIHVWSLRQFMDRDASLHDDIRGIDLSHDASLLALATETGIEIWDARIGQRRQVIQSRKDILYYRAVAFSPKGELIVSSSKDGFIVVDVRTGELMPITCSFSPPRGQDVCQSILERVGISFDSSKLAALRSWYDMESREVIRYIHCWDLPRGTRLHSLYGN